MNASDSPVLLDRYGQPLMSAGREASYSSASFNRELLTWRPSNLSADADYLRNRNTIVARTQDMIRNDGLTSGAVRSHLDSVIGAGLMLSARPDWRALGIDQDVAEDLADQLESKFKTYAEDNLNFYSDQARRLTLAGRLAQGYRSYLGSGEILFTAEWRKKRAGNRYRTCIRMVDPDRLSNKDDQPDSDTLRGGVELDDDGAAAKYHIAMTHPNDSLFFNGSFQQKWRVVPRETPWGRLMVGHIFDQERPDQTRGVTGFVTGLSKLKMLEKFRSSHLQAAILNAVYAAVLESSLPTDEAVKALGTTMGRGSPLSEYVGAKADFHRESNLMFDGVRIPHLFPGEQLKMTASEHPSSAFGPFEESILRYLAAAFNLSYEQLSRDYSKTNYSSARASLQEVWKFFMGRRFFISAQQATLEYALWFEEAVDLGEIVLPKGAPDFYEAKLEWTRCLWIGPGRQYIDPLKEARGDQIRYDMGVATFEELCADQQKDWKATLLQRAREAQFMRAHGLDPAAFTSRGQSATAQAEQDKKDDDLDKPDEEDTRKTEDKETVS